MLNRVINHLKKEKKVVVGANLFLKSKKKVRGRGGTFYFRSRLSCHRRGSQMETRLILPSINQEIKFNLNKIGKQKFKS